tara:strand:+ start:3045 stop:3386 length:342 start_codon:yes stop_codon:yes gene_type:complete
MVIGTISEGIDRNKLFEGFIRLVQEEIDGQVVDKVETNIPLYLTVEQVAMSLDVSEQHIWKLIKAGELESFRLGNGSKLVRVKQESLEKFANEQIIAEKTNRANDAKRRNAYG